MHVWDLLDQVSSKKGHVLPTFWKDFVHLVFDGDTLCCNRSQLSMLACMVVIPKWCKKCDIFGMEWENQVLSRKLTKGRWVPQLFHLPWHIGVVGESYVGYIASWAICEDGCLLSIFRNFSESNHDSVVMINMSGVLRVKCSEFHCTSLTTAVRYLRFRFWDLLVPVAKWMKICRHRQCASSATYASAQSVCLLWRQSRCPRARAKSALRLQISQVGSDEWTMGQQSIDNSDTERCLR